MLDSATRPPDDGTAGAAVVAPTVLVVLVAHDGATWLPRVLDALEAQTYPHLDVLAVDNISQDGSRELLLERFGEDRVLVADRDLGFGAALGMALDARLDADRPFVLGIHDDCALAPDAIEVLVDALVADPRLAAVGPKLRSWSSDRELQSVGWTVDITGRADSGVDDGELDQGQRDLERRTLYVSTAAILLRRDDLEAVGRFDRRYHVFRDDLDLCWRFWLTGREVEVVPDAVGRHAGGASNYLRLGQTRFIGPRYFAERNTLATLLKNYGAGRLAAIVPLYFIVGLAKVLGFLVTRRVSDAWQTVRAWLWNVLHLRETLRLRRTVQRQRQRSDKELKDLFGRVVPRVRAYLEAIVEWVAGADVAPAPTEEVREERLTEPETATQRLVRFARTRPVLVIGLVLGTLFAVGAWQLLVPGPLRGGELAPWPSTAGAFLGDYVSGWHEANVFGTSRAPSPAQALLGILQTLLFGSEYLASRALLFGGLLVGWVLALRAAQIYSDRRLPRVAAATVYVLSPPALAALATGQVAGLVVFATLPGIVAGSITLCRKASPAKRAWRSVAGVALLTAVAAAFEPLLLLPYLAIGIVVAFVGAVATSDAAWRRALLARLSVVTIGPVVLLVPWSFTLAIDRSWLAPGMAEPAGDPLWRWLLLAPDLPSMPGLYAGVGFVLAGVLGLVLAFRRSPRAVTALWLAALGGAVAAWALDRYGFDTWAPTPLFITAGAYAGLLALAFATAESQLTAHDFGWRQLAAAATAIAVTASVVIVATGFVREPWDAYRQTDTLPSFIARAAEEGDPFRVLVLADSDEGVIWEVVEGTGPTMAGYGVPRPDAALEVVTAAVDDLLARRDPSAAARLGALNVRYVMVPESGVTPGLDAALLAQDQLEPRPVAGGRLLTVIGAMPRAAVVAPEVADAAAELAPVPPDAEIAPIESHTDGGFSVTTDEGASVVLAEVDDDRWYARVGGRELEPSGGRLVRFDELPEGQVRIAHDGSGARTYALLGQLLAVVLAFSLALRPPGFARSFADEEDTSSTPWHDEEPPREATRPSRAVELEAELMARRSEPEHPGPEGPR